MATAVFLLVILALVVLAVVAGPDTRDTRYSLTRRRGDNEVGRYARRELP